MLSRLEKARQMRDPGSPRKVESLLSSLRGISFRDTRSLLRLHDALLFLRAFPHSVGVAAKADQLLAGIAQQITMLREAGADMAVFDSEQVSGVAGTRLTDTFTYEVA